MSQNSKFLIPNSLFTCQRTRGFCPRHGVSVSGEAGTYPALFSLSTTFFKFRKFFSERPEELFSPAQKREFISTPFRCQQLFSSFFSKNLFAPPRSTLPAWLGSARRSVPQRRERVMHLSALPVNDFLEFFSLFSHSLSF